MKKHCWEIRSSPHEVKVFFRNPTLNSHFKSRFFLVLPTVHPVNGWVSLEERFVKSTVARKKCFLYLMFSFLISQSQLIYYPNESCSLRQFHFKFLFHQQSNVRKATNTVKGCNLIGILDFRNRALVFSFPTNFLKTTAEVCCKEYNQLIDRVLLCMCL